MNEAANRWYRVPEVWLMIVMLVVRMIGSIALVATAFGNRDELPQVGPRIASPLPPTTAPPPAERKTP